MKCLSCQAQSPRIDWKALKYMTFSSLNSSAGWSEISQRMKIKKGFGGTFSHTHTHIQTKAKLNMGDVMDGTFVINCGFVTDFSFTTHQWNISQCLEMRLVQLSGSCRNIVTIRLYVGKTLSTNSR